MRFCASIKSLCCVSVRLGEAGGAFRGEGGGGMFRGDGGGKDAVGINGSEEVFCPIPRGELAAPALIPPRGPRGEDPRGDEAVHGDGRLSPTT